MKKTIKERLNEVSRNAWLTIGPLDVYVRISQIPAEFGPNLQIANVSVAKESQGHGHFTTFLREAEEFVKEKGWSGIYIENVLNQGLYGFLERNGYVAVRNPAVQPWPPCYFKVLV